MADTYTSAKLCLVAVLLGSTFANVAADGPPYGPQYDPQGGWVVRGCAPPGIACIYTYKWQWTINPCPGPCAANYSFCSQWCPTNTPTAALTFSAAGIAPGSLRNGDDGSGTIINYVAKCVPCTSSPTTALPTTSGPTTSGPTTSGPTTSGPTLPPTASPTTASPTTSTPTDSPTRVPTTYESPNCSTAEIYCRRADPLHCPACLNTWLKSARTSVRVLAALGQASSPCVHVQQQLLSSVLGSCPNLTAMEVGSTAGTPPDPAHSSQACVVATHAYLNRSDSTGPRYKCLHAVQTAAPVARVSTLLVGPNCSRLDPMAAHAVAALVPNCFTPCESAVFECFHSPRCRPYIVAPATGPVTFDYSMDVMLLPATANVQLQCANMATPAAAASVQPPTGNATCTASLDDCTGNASCFECWKILQEVNSGETASSPLTDNIFNCTTQGSAGLIALERACSPARKALNDSAACLSSAWACINDAHDDGASSQCLRGVVDVVEEGGLDHDDGHWYDPNDLGGSQEAWHETLSSSACQTMLRAVATTNPAPNVLNTNACVNTMDECGFLSGGWCPYWAKICDETPACQTCLAAPPAATQVRVRYTPSCKLPIANMQHACSDGQYSHYVRFLSCTSSVTANNHMVAATSVFGAISFIAALSVIAVIIGYQKDRKSLRERILLGVFYGNAIYSLGNMIPVGLEKTGANDCGEPVMGPAVPAVRGLWFMGKYTMVSYELLIIYGSIMALRSGSINMAPTKERAAHGACIGTGLIAFIAFYTKSEALFDDYNTATASGDYTRQQSALKSYDVLVKTMVQFWLFLLIMMVCAWVYQRFVLFARLKKQWDEDLEEAESDWNRDLWKRSDPVRGHEEPVSSRSCPPCWCASASYTLSLCQSSRFATCKLTPPLPFACLTMHLPPLQYVEGQRATKRRLLDLITEGYDEIARPLEAYVATFVLFAVPAVLMASDYCEESSEPASGKINCQHACEMVLALRTLATVWVYYRNKASRDQLRDIAELRRRIWWRLRALTKQVSAVARPGSRGRAVRYAKEDQVHMIPEGGWAGGDDGIHRMIQG